MVLADAVGRIGTRIIEGAPAVGSWARLGDGKKAKSIVLLSWFALRAREVLKGRVWRGCGGLSSLRRFDGSALVKSLSDGRSWGVEDRTGEA